MVNIKTGETIKGKSRSGVSSKGEYFLIEKKAEKGYDKVTVWASNPGDVQGATAVKVAKINDISFGHRQNKQDGKWYPECSVHAELTAVEVAKEDKATTKDYWMQAPDDVKDIFNLDF